MFQFSRSGISCSGKASSKDWGGLQYPACWTHNMSMSIEQPCLGKGLRLHDSNPRKDHVTLFLLPFRNLPHFLPDQSAYRPNEYALTVHPVSTVGHTFSGKK